MAQKIRAILILEVAGRPKEHVAETIITHVGELEKAKGVEMLRKVISDPKEVEADGMETGREMFSCFAEVEIEVIDFSRLTELIFDFFPSSVEIVDPANINLNSQEATTFINNLSGRLHRYDEIAKISQMQSHQLAGKLKAIREAVEKKKAEIEKGKSGEGKENGNRKKKGKVGKK